jgi:glycosyltransferase involved in cell wall biosynthesis
MKSDEIVAERESMKEKCKVLQLQLCFNVSASDLAEQITMSLPSDRFEVTSAFLRGVPERDELKSCAHHSKYFDFKKSDLKGFRRLFALLSLYKYCRKNNFDVIIAHRFKPMNMLMILNRILNIPVCIGVQHGIGDFDRPYRRIQSRLLLKSNWKIVGVSQAVYCYLVDIKAGFTSQNTLKIDNAIDINRAEQLQLSRAKARTKLGLNADAFIFGSIGRLVPVKGHIILIKAFSKIQKEYPDTQVVIIGEGRSRPILETTIKKLGLTECVHLFGARSDALQYIRAFDTFVMPSLSEGLPLALLEGMSGHLPVIGSNIPSLKSILEKSGGYSFENQNIGSLAEILKMVLRLSPQELRAKGENSYRYLCKEHDINNFRKQYRELIEKSS